MIGGYEIKKVSLSKVNGVGFVGKKIPRSVLVRNVMDMLEGNEDYGEPSFCEAEAFCDGATNDEMMCLLADMMSKERVWEIIHENY